MLLLFHFSLVLTFTVRNKEKTKKPGIRQREKLTKQILHVRHVKIESKNSNFETFLSLFLTSQSSSKQTLIFSKTSNIQTLSFEENHFFPVILPHYGSLYSKMS